MRDPTMAAALFGAQSEAMVAAAQNKSVGPMMAFVGINMAASAGGMNAQNLYTMGQQQSIQPQAVHPTQSAVFENARCVCSCSNTGNFCSSCGKKKPEPKPQGSWACSCGALSKGRFCSECGKPKPAAVSTYRWDKCGWGPQDKANPPQFCPQCGDPFNDADAQS